MKYARPPFPVSLFSRFCKTAIKLGYTVRGHRWKLLDLLLDYAELHPDFFRKR
jgi:hypothetical protein